ncbi:hypothetical protein PIB30_064378 [Stylosanthes scabra]|uniref:Uncharacterized protein n=1 Tax=Stylosanthes scabra TaxID=79078 RepID=A0ABU6ZKD1_9FABA|nr:hypothetical protein [Stylosanthes scabra]
MLDSDDSRDEVVQGVKIVQGREWDSSAELLMMDRVEDGEQEVKTTITKEILDEWKLLAVEQCPVSVASKERDPLAEIMIMKCNKVKEDWGRTVRTEEEVESDGEWVPETVGEYGMLKRNETSSGNGELEQRTRSRTAGLGNKENQPLSDLVENFSTKEFYDDEDFMSTLKKVLPVGGA